MELHTKYQKKIEELLLYLEVLLKIIPIPNEMPYNHTWVSKLNFCTPLCIAKIYILLGQNLEMEDEEDDPFNNKYLADLKEGRCILPPGGRESNISRLSELKWRNSMCPPHLKSSYPAETQFSSPRQFKEDDIKVSGFSFFEILF